MAIEVIKGQRTMAELAGAYEVHPNQVTQWKRQLLESLPEVFGRRRQEDRQQQEELTAQLYQQIGQLKVELDWLKKRPGSNPANPQFRFQSDLFIFLDF